MRRIRVFSRYSKSLKKLIRIKLTTYWVHVGIKITFYWHWWHFSLPMSHHSAKCQKIAYSRFQGEWIWNFGHKVWYGLCATHFGPKYFFFKELFFFLFCFFKVFYYCRNFQKNFSSWFQEQNVQVFGIPHLGPMGVLSAIASFPYS